ncbi:hypothetical protein BVG81_007845 [Haliangium sp. UPWRP_2]|nr:hypothetical protein BVG81_007845 [Haliangium sp. UPWRP_2]
MFKLAVEHSKRAIALDPTYQFAYANLVAAINDVANYCLDRGLDFSALVDDAEGPVKACGSGCAAYKNVQSNMATLLTSLAQQLLRRGDDPRPALRRAQVYVDALRKLVKQSPVECMLGRYADALETEYVLASGGDPTALAETALAALAGCKALDEQSEDPYVVEAWLYQARAAWAKRHGGQPIPFAESALRAARRAVELAPDSVEAATEKARAGARLAELSEPKVQGDLLAESLSTIDKVLKVKANAGALLALRAVVLNAQSRLTGDLAAQAGLARDSQGAWARALAINPLLVREYGPDLKAP